MDGFSAYARRVTEQWRQWAAELDARLAAAKEPTEEELAMGVGHE